MVRDIFVPMMDKRDRYKKYKCSRVSIHILAKQLTGEVKIKSQIQQQANTSQLYIYNPKLMDTLHSLEHDCKIANLTKTIVLQDIGSHPTCFTTYQMYSPKSIFSSEMCKLGDTAFDRLIVTFIFNNTSRLWKNLPPIISATSHCSASR